MYPAAHFRATYTPAAVPTTLMKNAVMNPTNAPNHQPIAPPIVAAMKISSFVTARLRSGDT